MFTGVIIHSPNRFVWTNIGKINELIWTNITWANMFALKNPEKRKKHYLGEQVYLEKHCLNKQITGINIA